MIKYSGALAGLQIVHVGGKSTTALTGGRLFAPSEIAVPIKGWSPEAPTAMMAKEIEMWIDWFSQAAMRAQQAGFDFVEIHAAHGYDLNQWLSPITNKRSDEFGGSIQNRSRLLLTIIKKIRKVVPKLLIAVRLPAQDHMPSGLSFNEMFFVVSKLQKAGVDLIDVSSGIGGWRRPEGHSGQGYLVEDAAKIKSHSSIPVIGVGGIESGEFIDKVIQEEKLDFAAIGRAILADPAAWNAMHMQRLMHRAESVNCG